MPVHVIKPRTCGKTEIGDPERCRRCGQPGQRRTLFDAFVNRAGWVRLCAACIAPESGPPSAYTGPYPITRHRPARPHLHIVGGAARP